MQVEAKKQAKCQKYLNQFQYGLKTHFLDNKMEDESISDELLAITVADAKQLIKEKKFVKTLFELLMGDRRQ